MKSFLKGHYQNIVMILTFCNGKFTKLQRSFKLHSNVCCINPLWYITLLRVNQEVKIHQLQSILLYSACLALSTLTCQDHIV